MEALELVAVQGTEVVVAAVAVGWEQLNRWYCEGLTGLRARIQTSRMWGQERRRGRRWCRMGHMEIAC